MLGLKLPGSGKRKPPEMVAPRTFREHLHLRVTRKDPYSPGDKLAVNRKLRELGFDTPEIYAVYDDASKIDFKKLPDQFVLKPSNLAAKRGVHIFHRIVGEHGYWDSMTARRYWKNDIVRMFAKWQQIVKEKRGGSRLRIIAEEYVPGRPSNAIPLDYKFYVFGGEVRFILQIDRNPTPAAMCFFDRTFEKRDFTAFVTPNTEHMTVAKPAIPRHAEQMLDVAARVSRELRTPFISVDMYDAPRGPLIGELTHSPGGPYYGQLFTFTRDYELELAAEWRKAAAALDVPLYELPSDAVIPRPLRSLPKSI